MSDGGMDEKSISMELGPNIRLIDLKCNIVYFSKGSKSNQTDCTPKRRSFRVNLILSFSHTDKHETQHVGQLIRIKGHIT